MARVKSNFTTIAHIKKYIKSQADFQTSSQVFESIDGLIKTILDEAIESAKRDKRKTVMGRDIYLPKAQV